MHPVLRRARCSLQSLLNRGHLTLYLSRVCLETLLVCNELPREGLQTQVLLGQVFERSL
jgi:hypothetical protein